MIKLYFRLNQSVNYSSDLIFKQKRDLKKQSNQHNYYS